MLILATLTSFHSGPEVFPPQALQLDPVTTWSWPAGAFQNAGGAHDSGPCFCSIVWVTSEEHWLQSPLLIHTVQARLHLAGSRGPQSCAACSRQN